MRYVRLWFSFLKMSWMSDMEYRLNLIVKVFGEFVWYAAQLSLFEVLYLHTNSISGWTVHGMRVFMGCLFLSDVLYMILFVENMDKLSSLVKTGELDLYLTKPIDSQFMVSFRRISTIYFVNLCFIISYLVWGVMHLPNSISAYQIFSFVVLAFSGMVTLYSIRFMFGCLTVVLQDAGNIQFLWHQIWRLGTRPDPIYPAPLRLFVLTVLPVAFVASVPSRVLVEGVDLQLLLVVPITAVCLLFLSHYLWGKALSKYTSASS